MRDQNIYRSRPKQSNSTLYVASIVMLLIMGLLLSGCQDSQAASPPDSANLAEGQTPTSSPAAVAVAASPTATPTSKTAALPTATPKEAESQVTAITPSPTLTGTTSATTTTVVDEAQTAVVEVLFGVVEVRDTDGTWTTVTGDAELNAGQRVRTQALSSANLLFYDGSRSHLEPETEISIDQLDANLPEDGPRVVVMTQWVGDSTHDVATRTEDDSRFEVNTPAGSGVAQGTVFQVTVSVDLNTYFVVTEGAVAVTNLDVTVIVEAGQISTLLVDQVPSEPLYYLMGEGEVNVIGPIWQIAGQGFQTHDHTILIGAPRVGDIVRVIGHMLPDGRRMADQIILLSRAVYNQFSFVGEVSDIGDESWRVADLVITVNDETDIDAEIEVDTIVRVDGVVMPNGQLLATRIVSIDTDLGLSFSFVGPVQTIDDEVWLIANQFILVDETTEIDEDIEVGELVAVHGVIMPDGTWLAERIERVEADEATFTIIGQVEQIDPWVVAGISFEIQDWTVIEPDIVVGDLVRVRGTILPDGTWVADSIVLVEVDPTLNVIIFVGTVSSIDPWIVNNHPLEVDEDSLIIGDIEPGDLVWVRVEILADGTWLIKSIHLVDVEFGLGCFEVHAIVVSVTNTQIVLNHWQPIVLTDEIEVVGTLAPNTLINFYACFQPDGIIIIVGPIIVIGPIVIILPTPAPTPVPPVETGNSTICHRPPGNPDNAKTLNVGAGAVSAHLGHGDSLGPCPDGDGGKSNGKDKDKDKGKGNGKKNK